MQLFFEVPAQFHLIFQFLDVLENNASVTNHLRNKESRTNKAHGAENHPDYGFVLGQIAEEFLKNCAD
jgi:hypothetical protein